MCWDRGSWQWWTVLRGKGQLKWKFQFRISTFHHDPSYTDSVWLWRSPGASLILRTSSPQQSDTALQIYLAARRDRSLPTVTLQVTWLYFLLPVLLTCCCLRYIGPGAWKETPCGKSSDCISEVQTNFSAGQSPVKVMTPITVQSYSGKH